MGQTLIRDVRKGDTAAVRKALETLRRQSSATAQAAPAGINSFDLDGFALLHWAALEGHTSVCHRCANRSVANNSRYVICYLSMAPLWIFGT